MKDAWSGRAGFILATIASAIGLGSVWKFPYELGANGGAAFLLFYLAGLALVVLPLMLAEFAIGRAGATDAAGSLERLAIAYGAGRAWRWVGLIGIAAGVLVLSFYSVIGGWTLAYAVDTLGSGPPGDNAAAVRARYEELLASPVRMTVCHAVFLALSAGVVARGINRGIEAASKLLMPLLAVLMVVLAVYSAITGDLGAALRFLFRLDATGLTARAALEALGLGFFSIGVGFGLMITYAAYAGPQIDLRQAAITIVFADTAISLLAGLAIFPLVFAHHLDPAGGPGLMFVTLPIAFARMPLGAAVAMAFFLLLFVAALGSAISMLELAVAFVVRRFGWSRPRASIAAAAACFVGGLATVFSFGAFADWRPTPFELLDELTSSVLLPLGGLGIAIFAGWILPRRFLGEHLASGPGATRVRAMLRWLTPALIATVALAPLFAT